MSVKMTSCLLALAAACLSAATAANVQDFFSKVNKGIEKEIQETKSPIESTILTAVSTQCTNVKNLMKLSYEDMDLENDNDVLNQLTLDFLSTAYVTTYNITTASQYVTKAQGYDNTKKLFIYVHGFTDNPATVGRSFQTIRDALFEKGEHNVLALDASSLLKFLYLHSTTYVQFMGQKLGEVLAALVNDGQDPSSIHLIGHSLGAHACGFTGKSFTKLTGLKIGRISGLDPAGPCFSSVDESMRLNSTDAEFVDVIHTDGGVFGMTDRVGDVDYFPNDGIQQPNCLLQTCSHSRAWQIFAETIRNTDAFPAVRCNDYEAFKKGECDEEVSYMGFPTKTDASGQYYLQTSGDAPFGLGMDGIKYKNTDGVGKSIATKLGNLG